MTDDSSSKPTNLKLSPFPNEAGQLRVISNDIFPKPTDLTIMSPPNEAGQLQDAAQ